MTFPSAPARGIERIIRGDGSVEHVDGNGDWHRDGDLPAIEHADGSHEWWVRGRRHRDGDRPAVVSNTRGQEWWFDGVLHRAGDLPAVVRISGAQEYWLNGLPHRVIGPARIPIVGVPEWWLWDVPATGEYAERLARVYSGQPNDSDLVRSLPELIGNDPWVAAVFLGNAPLARAVPSRVRSYAALLAANLPQK